jgi:hypothetical protein
VNLQDYNFPNALKKRGVDDTAKLPSYYYRDDGLALWEIILAFVGEIIGIFYKNDDDVKRDDEIQSWIYDVHKNGWRAKSDHKDHGVPTSFESREQLIEVLTSLIFTLSCQHAAVNFSQKDHFGFTPNAPAIMRKPPPKKKGEASLQSILSTLPNKAQAVKAIATVYILTKYSDDEVSRSIRDGKCGFVLLQRHFPTSIYLHMTLIGNQSFRPHVGSHTFISPRVRHSVRVTVNDCGPNDRNSSNLSGEWGATNCYFLSSPLKGKCWP